MSIPVTMQSLQVSELTCVGSCSLPSASIGNSQFTGSGASALEASKVQQQRTYCYSQDRNNWNAADWKALHLIFGAAGTIDTLKAKLPVECAAGHTVTVTWRLNGTSIGTATFTDADAANTVKTVAPSSTAVVAGDDLSVQITVSGANPGKGIMAYAKVTEYGS